MFELEQSIQDWKTSISRLETFRSCDVEELEQHLRDSIAELQRSGLSGNEAFVIATSRVGQTEALGQEFGKVNGGHVWGKRLFWMLAGFLFFEVVQFAISAMASVAQLLTSFAGGNGTAIGAASVAMTLLCWLGLAMWLRHGSTNFSDSHSLASVLLNCRGKAICVGLAGILLFATLAKLGSQVTVHQHTAIEEIGTAALIMAYANTSLSILIPLVLLVAMLAIRKKTHSSMVCEV